MFPYRKPTVDLTLPCATYWPGKTFRNCKTIIFIRNNVDKTYKHTKLRSVHRGHRHTVVKCHGFATFVLPFFRFVISSTGHNSRLIRTFHGSHNVFCLVHVPLQGFGAFEITFRGSSAQKNSNILTRFWTSPIRSGNRFSVRAVECNLPLNVKITPQSKIFDWKLHNRSYFPILAV